MAAEKVRELEADDPLVILWARNLMLDGYLQSQALDFMREGSHGWPYPDKRLGDFTRDAAGKVVKVNGRDTLRYVWAIAGAKIQAEEVIREQVPRASRQSVINKLWPGDAQAGGKRPQRNWDGRTNAARKRALQDQKAPGFTELWRLQIALNKLCSMLQHFHVEDYNLNEVALMTLDDLYDDLLSMSEWRDRTLALVQARLSDHEVKVKIAKLRDTTGRTPEEAKTALALADRLERKLEARLASA